MKTQLQRIHTQALHLAGHYREAVTEIKGRIEFLLQKFTFIWYSRKLGFKLAYRSMKVLRNSGDSDATGDIRGLATDIVKYFCCRTKASKKSIAALVANALRVPTALVFSWLQEQHS